MTDRKAESPAATTPLQENLQGGAYEVLRDRLAAQCGDLRRRTEKLNVHRKQIFGGRQLALTGTARVVTENTCHPRDLIQAGRKLVFGCEVFLGLKKETALSDVFSVFELTADGPANLGTDFLSEPAFEKDFRELFQYFKGARLQQLLNTGTHLLIAFQTGASVADVKVFRWELRKDGTLKYAGPRNDGIQLQPPQHDFAWTRATREMHVSGKHPHISIADLVFVECVGGDLTVKVENNTESGQGIYREHVSVADQSLDDAEIHFAVLKNLVLLKIKPFHELTFRYLVYNRITQRVQRIDAIAQACLQLPEGHGLVFPGGYLLQSGETKVFDQAIEDMNFQAMVRSPNGEDLLYIFHHRADGRYLLLPYNMIEKKAATPLQCLGCALLEDGTLVLVPNGHKDSTRSHEWQLWKSPFGSEPAVAASGAESHLARIGNRDLVHGLSELLGLARLGEGELTTLAAFENLVRQAQLILDRFHWLSHVECEKLDELLKAIRETGNAALGEFEKAQQIRRETARKVIEFTTELQADFTRLSNATFEGLEPHVEALTGLRGRRGHLETMRELRYADQQHLDELEQRLSSIFDSIASKTVQYLLQPEAFQPHLARLDTLQARIAATQKSAGTPELKEELDALAAGLDVLSEIVNGLPIDDPTVRTALLDALSETCAHQNRAKAALEARRAELLTHELSTEFAAQLKLLAQERVNYLSQCETPDKCDELQARMLAHIEELEARFAEAGNFAAVIADKRIEAAEAFAARKQALLDERQRKATGLATAAGRMLQSVLRRAAGFTGADELNAYFASDPMVRKAREQIEQLRELGDRIKADELDARLKSARQEAGRTLRDRLELFEDGASIIKLGPHRFSVHTQPVDLNLVLRDEQPCVHVNGTDYYQPVADADFASTRRFWPQEVASEDAEHYRAAYLAWKVLEHAQNQPKGMDALQLHATAGTLIEHIRAFAQDRYDEGYARGVHDHDAAALLAGVLEAQAMAGLLRYPAAARALACLYWARLADSARRERYSRQAQGLGRLLEQNPKAGAVLIVTLERELAAFAAEQQVLPQASAAAAAAYLFHELAGHDGFVVSSEARELHKAFSADLKATHQQAHFSADLAALDNSAGESLAYARAWLEAYVQKSSASPAPETMEETLSLVLTEGQVPRQKHASSVQVHVTGLLGRHGSLRQGACAFRLDAFLADMERFDRETVPAFRAYLERRKALLDAERADMQLDELRAKPMATFVRNRLIDQVYLPLIGANLAKQIGEAGENKRTDLMGMLLLISPPGYGKTTLMEYLAQRLGLIFLKVNGPALGHHVISLDPQSAPDATSRRELERLNFGLELGNNVLLYLDDIQHLNSEFLQKFISLCDAQRKIEGVFRGRTRTYDLRGKRFAVVMAGNPYTESGARFRIPDMLANRADTFNLGDIIGGRRDLFELSYLENALTSSPALRVLATRDPQDFHTLVEMAASGELRESKLSSSYSAGELQDMLEVLRKLRHVQKAILRVNEEYIRSASQSDEFRTEPAFKLQGSYRDMNKIAARVMPIMTDEELERVIRDHYATEAQALATAAEQNLLKLGELLGAPNEEDAARWAEIKRTFKRRQALYGLNADDQGAHVISQLASFNENLEKIRATLAEAATSNAGALSAEKLQYLVTMLAETQATRPATENKVEIVNTLPKYYGNLYKHHIDVIEAVLVPLVQGVYQQLREQQAAQTLLADIATRLKELMGRHENLRLRDQEASRIEE